MTKPRSYWPSLARGFNQFSAEVLPAGQRIACCIEYQGQHYSGWQSQPYVNAATVQDQLEQALSQVAAAPLRVHCAGRTDSGVHGCGQVVHFDAPSARALKSWVMGGNANLPRDIRIHWAQPVPQDFHARHSAQWRRYRYVIHNAAVHSALLGPLTTWHRYPLNAGLMHCEAQCLLGEHDFSAFRAAACQSVSPIRDIQAVTVGRVEQKVVIDIRANAFLHHMVRNIAGSLMAVGGGRQPAGWIAQLLEGRDRTVAADTAAASGLYLVEVGYPGYFELPAPASAPF